MVELRSARHNPLSRTWMRDWGFSIGSGGVRQEMNNVSIINY